MLYKQNNLFHKIIHNKDRKLGYNRYYLKIAQGTMNHILRLSLVNGIGPGRANRIINEFDTLEELFALTEKEIVEKFRLPITVVENILDEKYKSLAQEIIQWCDNNGVEIITPKSENYPQLLNDIYDPPIILYAIGDCSLLNEKSIALVGTREMTNYGKRVVADFVDVFVKNDLTVVSGLALGIDTISHKEVLDRGGKTVAVLPSSIDKIYPAVNRSLANEIKEKGVLISEYFPGSKSNKYCFVQRNRVVSGMCKATVVVEAGFKSGSLITANFATTQGRDLYAVPGSIYNSMSLGTNHLIEMGAIPAIKAETIISESYSIGKEMVEQLHFFETSISDEEKIDLEEDEEKLFLLIQKSNGLRVDEIEEQSGMDSGELFNVLLGLEMAGLIEQIPGGLYRVR